MKTWQLNPRTVEKVTPRGTVFVATEIDCPCGCSVPYTLLPVAGVTFPAVGETPTAQQWRQLLNDYTVPGTVHRVINGMSGTKCGWGGRIVNGKVYFKDAATEDDTDGGTRVEDTLAWLREKGDLSVRQHIQ